jgi:RNA polymerase sigma factor (sigma-70 family)
MIDTLYDSYMRDVRCFSRIKPEREVELSRAIINGRSAKSIERAVHELVEANLLLVIHCLKEFLPYLESPAAGLTRMDLIAEGNIGLMNAARNYDACRGLPPARRGTRPTKPGIRFSTYACRSIKNAMRRAVKLSRFIHIPEHHFAYWSQIRTLEDDGQGGVSSEEMSRRLGVNAAKLSMLKHSHESTTLHLEDLCDADGDRSWRERIPDPSARAPAREVETKDLHAYLEAELEALPERTRRMLQLAYFGEDPKPFSDLGREFGVSKERCRQVCRQGLDALRHRMEGKLRQALGVDSSAKLGDASEGRISETFYRLIRNPNADVAAVATPFEEEINAA